MLCGPIDQSLIMVVSGLLSFREKRRLIAELWAISNALDIAGKEILNSKVVPITIFCESQKALREIEHSPYHKENRFLRGFIYEKVEELKSNGNLLNHTPALPF